MLILIETCHCFELVRKTNECIFITIKKLVRKILYTYLNINVVKFNTIGIRDATLTKTHSNENKMPYQHS